MDLKQLWREKWFRYGAVGAGGLGLVALYIRKKTTGSTSAQPQQQKAAGGYGMFDSTGTDVAHWVGEHDAAMQAQLSKYQQDLTSSVEAFHAFMQPLGQIQNARPIAPQAAGDFGYSWDALPGAVEYVVHYIDEKGNSSGAYEVRDPSINFRNLDPSSQYQLIVTPWAPGGGYGQSLTVYGQTGG